MPMQQDNDSGPNRGPKGAPSVSCLDAQLAWFCKSRRRRRRGRDSAACESRDPLLVQYNPLMAALRWPLITAALLFVLVLLWAFGATEETSLGGSAGSPAARLAATAAPQLAQCSGQAAGAALRRLGI
jgi:hypothetical protein